MIYDIYELYSGLDLNKDNYFIIEYIEYSQIKSAKQVKLGENLSRDENDISSWQVLHHQQLSLFFDQILARFNVKVA